MIALGRTPRNQRGVWPCFAHEQPKRRECVEIAGTNQEVIMGRGILLWLLGIPIPIIILLALFWH